MLQLSLQSHDVTINEFVKDNLGNDFQLGKVIWGTFGGREADSRIRVPWNTGFCRAYSSLNRPSFEVKKVEFKFNAVCENRTNRDPVEAIFFVEEVGSVCFRHDLCHNVRMCMGVVGEGLFQFNKEKRQAT